jgi:hypothetical protein
MKKIILGFALALKLLSSFAQTSPGFTYGQIPTAGQWNLYFSNKQDYLAPGTAGNVFTSNGTTAYWAAPSPITNIYGGAANYIPYQTAPNLTSFILPLDSALMLSNSAGVPGWGNLTGPVTTTGAATTITPTGITPGPYTCANITANAAGQLTAASNGSCSSSGTVSSVGFSDASSTPIYTITNSPITTSGTINETLNTQSANTVFAGPASGSAAQPGFRAIVPSDAPRAPFWAKYTVLYTSISVGATTDTVTLFVLPAGGIVHQVLIQQSIAFTGGSISAVTASVGVSGSLAKYAPAFSVYSAPSATNYELVTTNGAESRTATTNVTATFNSIGGNLSTLAAGSVDVWALISTAL